MDVVIEIPQEVTKTEDVKAVDSTEKMDTNVDSDKKTGDEKFAEKLDAAEFNYLRTTGFSSELFKIEVKGFPKFYGIAEVRKLINVKLDLKCSKIKIPRKASPFGFFCFQNEEDREKAITTLEGYKWKGNTLRACKAMPSQDPLVRERKRKLDEGKDDSNKKPKTVQETSEPLSCHPYEEQLKMKQKKIEEVLFKFTRELRRANNNQKWTAPKPDELPCEMRDIIPSPITEEYRNKCEFSVGKTEDGKLMVGNRLGSYASGCLQVASVDDMKMVPKKMKLATELLREFISNSDLQPFNVESYEGHWRQLTIRYPKNNEELLMVIGIHPQNLTDEEKLKVQNELVTFFTEGNGKVLDVKSLWYEEIQKRVPGQKCNVIKHLFGAKHVYDYLLGLKFRISPVSFFQGNTLAAEKLYQCAIDLGKPTPETTVLDICCGTGTIGLCFAKHCKQVYGIEIISEAIEDANQNAKDNGIENTNFYAGNADDLITTVMRSANIGLNERCLAILDPARAGLHGKSIQQLRNAEKITTLIYISCSPDQAIKNYVDLAKNCSKTMKGNPFVPKVAVAVDMFPHTMHTELVILFERAADEDDEVEVKAE